MNCILSIWDQLFNLSFCILILPARLSKFYKRTLYLSSKSLIKILTKISPEDLCTSVQNTLEIYFQFDIESFAIILWEFFHLFVYTLIILHKLHFASLYVRTQVISIKNLFEYSIYCFFPSSVLRLQMFMSCYKTVSMQLCQKWIIFTPPLYVLISLNEN